MVQAGRGQFPQSARGGQADRTSTPPSPGERRSGHGRQGAQAYSGAEHVVCSHETLAVGERCPVCGRGRLYRVEPEVEMRLDGHALLSAIRYALEKFRCSACGQVFTAAMPAEAGTDTYSARARAVLVLGRYYLGVPLYRLEGYQAMVGVPIADATQWDQIERVADCAYPVFAQLQAWAAQGEVIYQDDTHVRILSLIAENRRTQADDTSGARTGRYTAALVASLCRTRGPTGPRSAHPPPACAGQSGAQRGVSPAAQQRREPRPPRRGRSRSAHDHHLGARQRRRSDATRWPGS